MPCFAKRQVQKLTEAQIVARDLLAHQKRIERKAKLATRQHVTSRHQKLLKKKLTPTRQRAIGWEGLAACQFGPDVVVDNLECTPLTLWNCVDPILDYNAITAKESKELIPPSPKIGDEAEEELIPIPESHPLSWDPELTDLEEDEFAAEESLKTDGSKLAYSLPLHKESDLFDQAIQVVQILRPDGTFEFKDRVRVILKETQITFHFNIDGNVILEGTQEAAAVRVRNDKYRKMCQQHIDEPYLYSDGSSQTFIDPERDKSTQLVGVEVLDKTQLVNVYIMYDDFKEIEDRQRQRLLDEEEISRQQNMIGNEIESGDDVAPVKSKDEDEDEESSDDEDKQQFQSKVDWTRVDEYFENTDAFGIHPPGDMNDLDEELEVESDEELNVKVEINELYAKRLDKALKSRPKMLPNISNSVLILERIVSTNRHQKKHMDLRGFQYVFKKELTRRQMYQLRNDALVDAGPTLKRFWSYKPNLTKGFEVTSISVHPTNGNIIAASYGSNSYPSATPIHGIVCIWNLKNVNLPEQTYHFDISATAVAFSTLTPYLLAIGLGDGNIHICDIRETRPEKFRTTEKMLDKPFGPIWDLFWLQETEIASTGLMSECLISVSDDGCLYRWTLGKGFEQWVLLKTRRSPLKIPGRREKRADALMSQWSATYTICFYSDDPTFYLIGTEEGFIHKCSTSYAEHFVHTYVSHTGPVYSIQFSPFAHDIFISSGGDWTIKIWKEDIIEGPLYTLTTGLRSVFDVAWAPTLPSVFVSTNEVYMEIWDVTVNTLEPIIQFKLPNLGPRRVKFYQHVQGLLIGDNDGGITLYALRNFSDQPETLQDKIDYLLGALIQGYKRVEVEPKDSLAGLRKVSEVLNANEEDEDEEEEEDEYEEDETDEYEEEDDEEFMPKDPKEVLIPQQE